MVCDIHFSAFRHSKRKVPRSSLSTFIYFGPHIFHFCRSAQTVPAFEAIVKVTHNMSVYIWINYGIWDSFVVGQDTNTAK